MLENILPAYATDLKQNFNTALSVDDLNDVQIWGSALAVACACRHKPTLEAVEKLATEKLDAKTLNMARGAASLMSANNIYWRFWYLVEDRDYLEIKPEFKEEIMHQNGLPEGDFECFCLAVSAINNCAGCLKVHSRKLLKLGFSKTQVMHVVRIAAVVHSLATTLASKNL